MTSCGPTKLNAKLLSIQQSQNKRKQPNQENIIKIITLKLLHVVNETLMIDN